MYGENVCLGNDAPVFIIGMNGSGTTMLADSLGNHPELYVLDNESKVLPHYLAHGKRYGDPDTLIGRRRIANSLGNSKGFWRSNGKSPILLSDNELLLPGIPAVIDATYRHLAHKARKFRWGDKSPANTLHISLLASAFPSAHFVHIIRDPRDAAQSFHRRWGYNPMHTVYRWKKMILAGREQGQRLGRDRYLEVTYEQLTAEPRHIMQTICAFLGLEFNEAVLKASMRHMDPRSTQATAGMIVPNSEKWRAYFDKITIDEMERMAGSEMSSIGYAVSSSGDTDPQASRILLWQMKDGLRFIIRFASKYGLVGLPVLARHLLSAIRQRSVNK